MPNSILTKLTFIAPTSGQSSCRLVKSTHGLVNSQKCSIQNMEYTIRLSVISSKLH